MMNTKKKDIPSILAFAGLLAYICIYPIIGYLPIYQFRILEYNAKATIALSVFFFILFLIFILTDRMKEIKLNLAYLCVVGLALVAILNVMVTENKDLAIWGDDGRNEGIFALLGYYLVFFFATRLKKEERKWIIYALCLLGVVTTVTGILQFFDIYNPHHFWRFLNMAYIPMGNPNFYGSFAVMFSGIAMAGALLYEKESNVFHPFGWMNQVFWYALSAISFITCIVADSSLCYVGIAMMFLLMIFLEIINKKHRFLRIAFLLILLVAMLLLFNLLSHGKVLGELFSVGKQISNAESIFSDEVGTGRMEMWKNGLKLLPSCWLFGCGIENLLGIYTSNFGPKADGRVTDKVHNEYLNLWLTEGTFALVFYLVFLFALFVPGIVYHVKSDKYEQDEVAKIAFIAFFGYIAQAFFNISVIQVAPYFWMICGLLMLRKKTVSR